MNWRLLLALAVFGFSLPAHRAQITEPVSVDAICGKLVAIESRPETGAAGSEAKPIGRARLRLFSPTGGADCCALITPVAEVSTGRDGTFQFKKPSPGDYWLVLTMASAEYKMLIRFQPGKKGEAKCSEFLYALEKGQLHLQSSKASVTTLF